MKQLKGLGVSNGFAIGKALLILMDMEDSLRRSASK